MKTLIILGACGTSREAYWVAREANPDVRVVFVEDVGEIREVPVAGRVIPVVKDWDFSGVRRDLGKGDATTFTEFVVGMGYPKAKKSMVEKALSHGLRPAPTVIGPQTIVRSDCTVGRGGIIHPNSTLTANITVGDFVTVHAMAGIGHDTIIGNYSTCSSGTILAGEVQIDEGVFLGIGTVVRERLHIAPWVVTGMQSCVVRSIEEPHVVVAGVPARKMGKPNGE